MRNPKDPRTKILPSSTRRGKELPSSSALDSHAVLSKFATSPPPRNLDMSPVLDDATFAAHDAYDAMLDTMPDDAMLDAMLDDAMLDAMPDDAMLDTMPDTTLPLDALDAHIARVAARCDDTSETADTIEVEQVLKAQNDLLNELNDNSIRVVTRGSRMTQEPLYPEGHPKRIEQDSQGVSTDAPSHPRKKKKDDRNLHASNRVAATPESPNDASISDAKTQSSDEHEPNDNINSDVDVDAQPSNEKDVEIEPSVDLDNP
ncbi:hypothetical protein ZWY2020_006468 [Hordeum vulgare]|nr:hypothetical protein ZWY2020_006468 [Hordeum vulgare]